MRILRVLGAAFALAAFRPAPAEVPDLDVEVRGDGYSGLPDGAEPPRFQGWATVAPRWSSQSGRAMFSVRALLESDTHGEISRDRLYDDDDRELQRSPLRFEELLLRLDFGALDLELGRQRLAWGRADVVHPTDNLTPRDWLDPLDEQRLSPWAARADYEKGRWSGELVAIPRYAPSRLPLLGGRWFPAAGRTVPNPAWPLQGPKLLDVELDWDASTDFPATTWSNVQEALRAGRRGERLEWSLSYFRGFDDAPRVTARPAPPRLGAGVVPVELTRRFPRLDVTGGDFTLLAGRWAVRGEAGYFHYPDGLDDGYLLYDLETEWSRGNLSLIVGGADSIGAESGGSVLTNPTGAAGSGTSPGSGAALAGIPTALDQVVLPAGYVRFGRTAATEWEASVEAMVGLDRGDRLVRAGASWPVTDRVRAGGEADLLAGPADTLFGSWRRNDRLRLFVRIGL